MKNNLTQSLAKYFLSSGGQVSTSWGIREIGQENLEMLNATRTSIKLIENFFSPINALASKPVFTIKNNSVIVYVFYYIPVPGKALNNNTVNNLGDTLSKLFKRPVEIRLVKLHYPYLNSYILAQYIACNAQNYKLVQIVRRVFSFVAPVKNTQSIEALASALPSHIVGIKVEVSGRLVTERSRPRQTVQTAQIGSFSKSNISLVDKRSYTTKNKKGALTIKVWISQQAVV
jgi:ribosomal protein S3